MSRYRFALALTLVSVGCFPEFDDRPFLIEEARVLAIRGTPAEARPGDSVAFEALVVGPDGSMSSTLNWSFCTRPRSAEETGGVTASCAKGEDLTSTSSPGFLPTNACALFGPNPPPTEGDEAPLRPSDPDPSAGYFVPLRAATSIAEQEVAAFGFLRVRCDLAGATRDVFEAFEAGYTDNLNPQLQTIVSPGAEAMDGSYHFTLPASSPLDLRAISEAGSAEPYLLYLPEENRLEDLREDLRVDWFFTAGELNRASERRKGASVGEGPAYFDVEWLAPPDPGLVHGWVVLHDARGGSDWLEFTLEVTP